MLSHFTTARIHIAPALAALGHNRNSRIFQEKSVVQILKEVVAQGLKAFDREADFANLRATEPPKREYTVQYQESDLAFAMRLMEEEGISFTFDHSGKREKCVFVEENANFLPITTMEGGNEVCLVPLRGADLGDSEPVFHFELRSDTGPTAVATADFDWTLPEAIRQQREGQDAQGRSFEVYDHARGITFADYSEGSKKYGRNNLKQQTRLRMQAITARSVLGIGGKGALLAFGPGKCSNLRSIP